MRRTRLQELIIIVNCNKPRHASPDGQDSFRLQLMKATPLNLPTIHLIRWYCPYQSQQRGLFSQDIRLGRLLFCCERQTVVIINAVWVLILQKKTFIKRYKMLGLETENCRLTSELTLLD